MMSNVFDKLKGQYRIMCDAEFCQAVLDGIASNPSFTAMNMRDENWNVTGFVRVFGHLFNVEISNDQEDEDTVNIDLYLNVNTVDYEGKAVINDCWVGGVELLTEDFCEWLHVPYAAPVWGE